MNLPGIDLGISAFTAQDREILAFAAAQRLDAVSCRSCRASPTSPICAPPRGRWTTTLRDRQDRAFAGAGEPRRDLASADGLMVARGDLAWRSDRAGRGRAERRHPPGQSRRQAGDHRDAHARVDDKQPRPTRARRRRRERHPRRHRLRDVVRRDAVAAIPSRREDDGGDRPRHGGGASRPADGEPARGAAREGELSEEDVISLTVYFAVEALRPDVVCTPSDSGGTPRRITRFRLPVRSSPSATTPRRARTCSSRTAWSRSSSPSARRAGRASSWTGAGARMRRAARAADQAPACSGRAGARASRSSICASGNLATARRAHQQRRVVVESPGDDVHDSALALHLAVHAEQACAEHDRALALGERLPHHQIDVAALVSSVMKVTSWADAGRWRVMTRPAVRTRWPCSRRSTSAAGSRPRRCRWRRSSARGGVAAEPRLA